MNNNNQTDNNKPLEKKVVKISAEKLAKVKLSSASSSSIAASTAISLQLTSRFSDRIPQPKNKLIGMNDSLFAMPTETKSYTNANTAFTAESSTSTGTQDYVVEESDDVFNLLPEHERKRLKQITPITQSQLIHKTDAEKAKAAELAMEKDTSSKSSFNFSENQYKKHNVQWLAHKALQDRQLIEQKAAQDRLKLKNSKRKYGF